METLQKFTERMSKVKKEDGFFIGRQCYGNSRAIFCFQRQYCYLESRGYRTYGNTPLPAIAKALLIINHPPKSYWWTDWEAFGEARAKQIALYYHGEKEATFYDEEGWFHFTFDKFEDLIHLVYDKHTNRFSELFGNETKEKER